MSQPFLSEIRIFGGNFAPRNWALCNGQILAISQNTALFSLLGTNFGGNGQTTFALPDLQGRAPLGPGQGPGLQDYVIGQSDGESSVLLINNELPVHTHVPTCLSTTPNPTPVLSPAGKVWAVAGSRRSPSNEYATALAAAPMNATALPLAGGGQPHNNMHPYLALTFIIALNGIYPARN